MSPVSCLQVYVQDLILQEGPALWSLFEAGAHVYVCGDARRMAPDVRNAFKEMAKTCGGRNASAAESWMGGLLEAKRYLEDVWAADGMYMKWKL
jgi:sulfite reductase alpha subunit-like flavoprotein